MTRSRSVSRLTVVVVSATLLLLYAQWREESAASPRPSRGQAGPVASGGEQFAAARDEAVQDMAAQDGIAHDGVAQDAAALDALADASASQDARLIAGAQPAAPRVSGFERLGASPGQRLSQSERGGQPTPAGWGPAAGSGGVRELVRPVGNWRVKGREPHPLWAEVLAGLADPLACPRYEGMPAIKPQVDLAPLAGVPDPGTGLFLFCLEQSGAPPLRRAADGQLDLHGTSALVLALIPGGDGVMGADPAQDEQAEEAETPAHPVKLSPYYIALTETTRAQWMVLRGQPPTVLEGLGPEGLTPAVEVSYDEVRSTLADWGLDLPTEAQWEFAARAGTRGPFWTGADEAGVLAVAWVDDNSQDKVHAVASAGAANGFGLFDVHGSVWELCRDGLRTYDASAVRDPVGPEGGPVIRGGSWDDMIWSARSSSRDTVERDDRFANLGFRVARDALR